MPAKTNAKTDGPTFEDAMRDLEGIVEAMETKDIALEELILKYEAGLKLVKVCEERLKSAGQRIEMITRRAGGEVAVEPFEESAPAAAAKAPAENRGDVSLF